VIVYETTLENVGPEDLAGFFVGWPSAPSPERHLELLRGSEHVVLARESESERVVGFVTVVGDGVLSAFVPLLEVLPEHQGRGIGTELVRRALDLVGDRYMVDLLCDEGLTSFYERFGMQRVAGMALRNRDALSG
jgi:ribosomal protein S18 acetylase RimI-like enzyme